ncbi:MAG: hypothetical protein ABIK07_26725 [Planctomycetota bacterium]
MSTQVRHASARDCRQQVTGRPHRVTPRRASAPRLQQTRVDTPTPFTKIVPNETTNNPPTGNEIQDQEKQTPHHRPPCKSDKRMSAISSPQVKASKNERYGASRRLMTRKASPQPRRHKTRPKKILPDATRHTADEDPAGVQTAGKQTAGKQTAGREPTYPPAGSIPEAAYFYFSQSKINRRNIRRGEFDQTNQA